MCVSVLDSTDTSIVSQKRCRDGLDNSEGVGQMKARGGAGVGRYD